jgi:hypothetical protein
MVVYNVARLALLVVCLGLGWLAGLRSFALIIAALLVSGILSWFVLRGQREVMGAAVERTVERSRVRMAEHAAAEDQLADDMAAPRPPFAVHPPAAKSATAASRGDHPVS